MKTTILWTLLVLLNATAFAQTPLPKPKATKEPRVASTRHEASVSSIEVAALADFEQNAPQIQQLIRSALDLIKRNLTYTFGAADPQQDGMDCSGTIFYLLGSLKIKDVPRRSDKICNWVRDHTLLHRITAAANKPSHHEFAALQPGDLLFWSGTYSASARKTPVTHVMLYLGKLKKTGQPVMFGASDGRVYQGEPRTGVSVFDFTLPSSESASSFYGYGLIPGVGRIVVKPREPSISASPASRSVDVSSTLFVRDWFQNHTWRSAIDTQFAGFLGVRKPPRVRKKQIDNRALSPVPSSNPWTMAGLVV